MNNHHFCKALLSSARIEAKKHGVEVPKRLRALRSDSKHFYISHSLVDLTPIIKADCAYHAKATWIMAQLERD